MQNKKVFEKINPRWQAGGSGGVDDRQGLGGMGGRQMTNHPPPLTHPHPHPLEGQIKGAKLWGCCCCCYGHGLGYRCKAGLQEQCTQYTLTPQTLK